MNLEKAIMLSFFISMLCMVPALLGGIVGADAVFKGGIVAALSCGAAMILMIIYDVVTRN